MKKIITFVGIVLLGFGACVYAIDTLSRTGQKISIVQAGTSTTSGSTLVESTSTTNVFQLITITASVAAGETTFTNTFTTPFLATPTVVQGIKAGQTTGYGSLSVVTPSTTQLLVTLVSTNASATNGVPYIVYGYQRTGKLE